MKFSVHRSRTVLGGIAGGGIAGLLLFLLGMEGNGFLAFLAAAFGFIVAAAMLLLYWLSAQCYLELTNEQLIHHIGPIALRVTLDRIRTVDFVEDASLAPAWSAERVQIMLYPHEIMKMSLPEDKEAFVQALRSQCPHVKIGYTLPDMPEEVSL